MMKPVPRIPMLLVVAAVLMLACGCESPHRDAPADTGKSLPPDRLTPVQSYNRYLRALSDGDAAGIAAWIYAHPDPNEQARRDGSISVFCSTARLRKAFDHAYGYGELVKLGFHCLTPETHLPSDGKIKLHGDRATITAPGWPEIPLIRKDNMWKEELVPWSNLQDADDRLALNQLLPNMQSVSAILDQTAAEVTSGAFLSAADAFGVLNARLRGHAGDLSPLEISYSINLTPKNISTVASTTSSIPIFDLRGDPTQLGKSQGTQLAASIQTLYHDYFSRAFDLTHESGRKNYQQALKTAAEFEPFLLPEHLGEVRALAAGSGLTEPEVMLGQCFPDLNPGGACSTITLPAAAAPDQIARFARNLDYETFRILERHTVVLVFHPENRYAFASVAAPGLIGVLSGMNEHGLTVACMEVPRPARPTHAMPYTLLYRTLLERCRTVEEALALLKKTPRQSAGNLMLMDASGDRAVAELTPSQISVRRAPDDAALVSTNHQRGNDLNSPGRCNRFDFLHDAARRQFGALSESSVEQLLAGAAQGDSTFQSMVFEPVNKVIHLATGADAPTHSFATIDLKPYFRH